MLYLYYILRFIGHIMTIIKYLIFALLLSSNIIAQGLEIYGRVYDGNAKYNSINDADLIIQISNLEANIKYPIDKKGSYKAIQFNIPYQKEVKITAIHPDYIQENRIEFNTTAFKLKQNIRMIKKNAYAENNYYKAKRLKLTNSNNIDKAFYLTQEAIQLAPRGRYYLFMIDLIGKRLKKSNELPLNMIEFITNINDDNAFNAMPRSIKKEFFIKEGFYFSKVSNLFSRPDEIKTSLQYAIEAFDNAIKLSPQNVLPYQGKYLVLRKSNNYLDAIDVIKSYFDKNDPIKSELTIKGLLVDWIDLIRLYTDFKGSQQDIEDAKSNTYYKTLWCNLYKRLNEYKNYYKNVKIKGNKNLKNAYITSQRICNEQK